MRKRVLVVDDVPDWRATLQAILRNEYEVKTVDSYQAAMEVVRERSAELVIVDLRLSPTNEEDRQGMELLRQLVSWAETRDPTHFDCEVTCWVSRYSTQPANRHGSQTRLL